MDAEQSAITAKCREGFFRDPALYRENREQRKSGVAFGQDEAITIRIVRRGDAQDVTVQDRQNIGNAKIGADMPDVRALRLPQNNLPDSPRGLLVQAIMILRNEELACVARPIFRRFLRVRFLHEDPLLLRTHYS